MEKLPRIMEIANAIIAILLGGITIYKWCTGEIEETEAIAYAFIMTMLFSFDIFISKKIAKIEEGGRKDGNN